MVLRDSQLAQALARDGYLLLDAGLVDETDRIRDFIERGFALPDSGFYYSLMANDFEGNKAIRDFLRDTLTPFYETHFTTYRTVTESFLNKPAHTHDELFLHQDWCYTDEALYDAYNVWFPLDDVTAQNGALFFLPGSHKWFCNYRSGTFPTARISMREMTGKVETVSMKRGQVLLFHPAVFHGSHPNTTAKNRPVATATVMDREAPFLFYAKNGSGQEAEVYRLPDEALLNGLEKLAMGGKPEGAPLQTLAYRHAELTAQDLVAKQVAYDQ